MGDYAPETVPDLALDSEPSDLEAQQVAATDSEPQAIPDAPEPAGEPETPQAPEPAGDPAPAEAKAYEPGELDISAYTCDDCVYLGTCPKYHQDGPSTCGSFQWKSV